jgi:hypothetical protein
MKGISIDCTCRPSSETRNACKIFMWRTFVKLSLLKPEMDKVRLCYYG